MRIPMTLLFIAFAAPSFAQNPPDERFSYVADLFDLPSENLAEQHARVLRGMWDSSRESAPGD